MQPKPYEAVTRAQLVARLGAQCSPMGGRAGYVIGPAVDGRICHVATCYTLDEAISIADASNAYYAARPTTPPSCARCAHTCPTDANCPKCGSDPMSVGDTLCADCDAAHANRAEEA